ncbi:19413_t:CDS:2 [Funneliformis geosporum]|uniref:19413_t:CDS:1 n=1 Tax=Funneliformis geosporum TaxID=1117311 RepID=A0A9W4SWB9_9GLOM|nr:19413_t:CDS:2 [Funneliformis geosporum]
MSYQNPNSYCSLYFYLEDWKKTLFARTAIDLDLNNEAIILLPLPETESKTHIYKNCCYDYFKKIILKKDSKLLVNDASYLHLYLITHDEMNAFDVKWCIINSKPPRINHNFDTEKLIMVSSPKDLNTKKFCKPVNNITIKVYMQIWSEAELEEQFSKDNLHESYQLCDGIQRMIFKCKLSEINKMITASVNNIGTDIFRYIGKLSDDDNYSHNLVHIYTNEKLINEIINRHIFVNSPYTFCELKFTSAIVSDKVFARLKEFYKEEIYKFVFLSASVSLLAYFEIGKNRKLNEFEREKVIVLWIGGRTHEAISCVLKIPKSTITDIIS